METIEISSQKNTTAIIGYKKKTKRKEEEKDKEEGEDEEDEEEKEEKEQEQEQEEKQQNKKNYKCHCTQGVKSHLSRKGLCADSAHQSTYGRADLTTLILRVERRPPHTLHTPLALDGRKSG